MHRFSVVIGGQRGKLFKLTEFFEKLEKECRILYNIRDIHCGGEGKLPVEYCVVKICFEQAIDTKQLDTWIQETGYEEIRYTEI